MIERAGRVGLITGASSGLGAATARRLAREPGLRLVLVARRADRLEALAAELSGAATALPLDLLDDDAPARARAHLEEHHGGRLDLLVNNAGAGGRGPFADTGYALVHEVMALNFDAQVRMTEALLPLLRASAPSAIVNVASTAGRVARGGVGAYSASKAALAVWSDALRAEEHAHGVHVGTVMPGFIPTEGFPQRELAEKRSTRWLLGTEEQAADAIAEAGLDRRAERYVPRGYAVLAALRTLAPGIVRRVLASKRADVLATTTRPQDEGEAMSVGREARSAGKPQESEVRSAGKPQEGEARSSPGRGEAGDEASKPRQNVRHADQTRSG